MYCIDTSALIHAWHRAYPISIFPNLWENLGNLISEGLLISPEDVKVELIKKDDDLFKWCTQNNNNKLFIEINNEIQNNLIEIMNRYPRLVDTSKGKNTADPVVIALALSKNPILTVVTEELGGSERKPKIPYVCTHENITCINTLDLIKRQAWKF